MKRYRVACTIHISNAKRNSLLWIAIKYNNNHEINSRMVNAWIFAHSFYCSLCGDLFFFFRLRRVFIWQQLRVALTIRIDNLSNMHTTRVPILLLFIGIWQELQLGGYLEPSLSTWRDTQKRLESWNHSTSVCVRRAQYKCHVCLSPSIDFNRRNHQVVAAGATHDCQHRNLSRVHCPHSKVFWWLFICVGVRCHLHITPIHFISILNRSISGLGRRCCGDTILQHPLAIWR